MVFAQIEIEDVREPFCGKWLKTSVRLPDRHPHLAAEWDYKRNCGWGPEDFSFGSNVNVWWTCSNCRQNFKKQISKRTKSVRLGFFGCSFCAQRKACSANSLLDLYPEIAREFHPTLNRKLKASELVASTKRVVWWLCEKKLHVWKQAVSARTRHEASCLGCYRDSLREAYDYSERDDKGRIVLEKNSKKGGRLFYEVRAKAHSRLSQSHPKIAKQWHPTKNGPFTAADFSHSSEVVAWWKCDKGPDHEWQSVIGWRARKGKELGCPFCSNFRVSAANSLQKHYPEIAAQFHKTKNGERKVSEITFSFRKPVWWKCPEGSDHEWCTSPFYRTLKGHSCPFCSNHRVSKTNNLANLAPHIAAQWDYKKNGKLTPKDVGAGAKKKVWWLCQNKHGWLARVGQRTATQGKCPTCRVVG